MKPSFYPTRAHLLLCTGSSCRQRGAQELLAGLRVELESRFWAYYRAGGNLRLTASGCLGACSFGPTLAVYRPEGPEVQAWYYAATLPLALRVAEAARSGQPWPQERRFGA